MFDSLGIATDAQEQGRLEPTVPEQTAFKGNPAPKSRCRTENGSVSIVSRGLAQPQPEFPPVFFFSTAGVIESPRQRWDPHE